MKDGKLIYSLHMHVDLFTAVRFHPTRSSCKDLRQVAKFCDRLNPKFQTYTTWNWHTESTTSIFVIVLLSMHPVWFVDSVYCWSQLHHVRNNIVNVPSPTLAEYKYFSLSRQHIESTKIHLAESVIIQKKMSRSNAKFCKHWWHRGLPA